MKKNLFIFCDFYLPSTRAGGPVRSIVNIVELLKSEMDITIITRNHDSFAPEPFSGIEYDMIRPADGYRIAYLSEHNATQKIREILKTEKIDIIYFNSFFSPKFSVLPRFWLWLWRNKTTRVIISPRGELGEGALSIRSARKKWYLPFFKNILGGLRTEFLAASSNEKEEVINLFGKKFNVTALANMSSQKFANEITNHKNQNEIKIIFVSRIAKKKNLIFALEVLSKIKGKVTFDIYGPIEFQDYWEMCLKIIAEMPNNITVTYRGELHPDQVFETIQSYDLFFLPTWHENYGHAIVESLAAGCPVLLSTETPWNNVAEQQAGWAFPLSQPDLFVEKIEALISLNSADYARYKQGALQYYLHTIFDQTLVDSYREFFDYSECISERIC